MIHARSKALAFVFDNSLPLLAGTAAAVLWANVDHESYDAVAHSLHFWVNEIGMVFFFALAAKEVFEATLPGGPLASPRRAMTPLAAAVGRHDCPGPHLCRLGVDSRAGGTDPGMGHPVCD